MTAYFIVRAQVVDAALKDDFDRWYQKEHLPDARKGFKARCAWRGWSAVDPLVHYAYYEFDDMASARAIQGLVEARQDSPSVLRFPYVLSSGWLPNPGRTENSWSLRVPLH